MAIVVIMSICNSDSGRVKGLRDLVFEDVRGFRALRSLRFLGLQGLDGLEFRLGASS